MFCLLNNAPPCHVRAILSFVSDAISIVSNFNMVAIPKQQKELNAPGNLRDYTIFANSMDPNQGLQNIGSIWIQIL